MQISICTRFANICSIREYLYVVNGNNTFLYRGREVYAHGGKVCLMERLIFWG